MLGPRLVIESDDDHAEERVVREHAPISLAAFRALGSGRSVPWSG